MRIVHSTLLVLLPLALACDAKTTLLSPKQTPEDPATVDTPDCDGMARILSPVSDGQTDFYFLDDIAFEVNKGEGEALITVVDAEGEPVLGSTWIDPIVQREGWSRVVFTPDAPLSPNTEHAATLSYCGGAPAVEFSTSALGTPIESPEILSGRRYAIDLSEARVIRPGQVAQALLSLVDHNLLVQIEHAEATEITLSLGAANKVTGIQDTCIPTLSVNVDVDLNGAPTISVGPMDVEFELAGYNVTLYAAMVDATFAADGSHFAGGRMAGMLDARDVVDALAGRDILPADEPEAICDLLNGLGLACTACADGAPLCLEMEIDGVHGVWSDRGVESVDDFDCHEDCEDSCDNEECALADEFQVCI